jgi:selenocysteine lyase/cysteine desulfurase
VRSQASEVRSQASEVSALSDEFGPFDGRVWMNCAHEGPLPRRAQRAAVEAIELKRTPARLDDALFAEVPTRLRAALARLTNAPPEQIALTNSTSYGFNLLARGLPSTRPSPHRGARPATRRAARDRAARGNRGGESGRTPGAKHARAGQPCRARAEPGARPRARSPGIDIALRDGKLRFSPHPHNSAADVDRVLQSLHELV